MRLTARLGDPVLDTSAITVGSATTIPSSMMTDALNNLPSDPANYVPPLGGDPSTCYPTGFTGPLPPDGTWCATGTGIAPNNSPVAVTNWTYIAMGGILLAFIAFGVKK